MKKSEFWFDLPQEQIAQTPIEPRDHSRLLVMDRQSGACSHHHFYDIIDYLNPGDLLVVNDSRVIPARLYGIKPDTGGHIEVLLLEQKEKDVWEALVKPGKKAKPGGQAHLWRRADDRRGTGDGGGRQSPDPLFLRGGKHLPGARADRQHALPPYITAKLEDNERYQTVYSHELGSAAAPTAGLHFTNELLDKIRCKGDQRRDGNAACWPWHLPSGQGGRDHRAQNALRTLLSAAGDSGPDQPDQGKRQAGHRGGHHQLPHPRDAGHQTGPCRCTRRRATPTSSSIRATSLRYWTD